MEDAEIRPLADEILETIKAKGANIIKEEDLGKKKLAYPIKKFRHGLFFDVLLEIDSSKLPELEKAIKANDNIIRYLIVKMDEKSLEDIENQKERAARPEINKPDAESKAQTTAKEESQKEKEHILPAKTPSKMQKDEIKDEEKLEKPSKKLDETEAKQEKATEETEEIKEKEPLDKSKEKAIQEKPKKKKISIEELDKKLEEILDEDLD